MLLCALLLLPAAAPAQTIRDRLQQVAGPSPAGLGAAQEWFGAAPKRAGISYGGWSAPAVISFDDSDFDATAGDAVRNVLVLDQRAWARWDMKGGDSVYVRARYLDLKYDLAPGNPAPPLLEEGISLDLGYIDLPRGDWSFRLGRQFLTLGRGVTLSQNLDALRVAYGHGQWDLSLFAATTPEEVTDLDPVIGESSRDYAALTAQHLTVDGHRLFGYLMEQNDRDTVVAGQGLRYDSTYAAVGAEGPVVGDLGYYIEGIREHGSSPERFSASTRSFIDGGATLAELAWRQQQRHHPVYWLMYARGSGDADRGSAITNSAGNLAGTDDFAFIGMGRFDGGLALSPRLTNLVMWQAGMNWKFRELDVEDELLVASAFVSRYRKDEALGPISQPAASLPSSDIGIALDASLSYKPWHDLTVSLLAGRFWPGDAFTAATRDPATVVYAGLTYSY